MKNHSRFMKFIGGRDLLFALVLLLLIGFTILVFSKISFIFHPILVIFSTVTPPVILAFIAYYLMNPIVNLFERLHIKRIWGIIIIIVVLSGLFTGVILVSAPAIQAQINELITRFPKYLMQMADGLKATIDHSFLGPYYDDGYEWVTSTLADIPSIISDYFGETFTGIINFASTLTNVMVAILTFPIILFFLLKDGARFKEFCLSLLPPKLRREANKVLVNMDVQVGSYIQGQIIVASYIGETFTGIINFASTLTNVMVAILTFPIILFFLLKDGARFKEFCLSLLPPKLRREANKVLVNMDVQVGSYIQGQIIVASCIGVLLFIGRS